MTAQQTVKKIKAGWLESDIVVKVVEALGAESLRFVGGVVRDTLLGLDIDDIDAATPHKPERTIELLKAAGIKVIPTGLQHGTVTAVLGERHIEITTLRVDVETDGRHAEVVFTDSWLEDAKRRDFTFNAMYLTPSGAFFDPFEGMKDLKAGRVKFIGDAAERIKEDALRIMRLFRFHAHFGKTALEPVALEACQKLAPMLQSLSVERIRAELSKLLKATDPMPALSAMAGAGVFIALGQGKTELSKLKELIENEHALKAGIDPLLRLYQLFQSQSGARDIAIWLKLSRQNKLFIQSLERALNGDLPQSEASMRRYIYHHGVEASKAAALCLKQQRLFLYCDEWQVPSFPLQGRDLMARGMLAGPAVGEALKVLESEWVGSDFSLTKQMLLKQLRTV